MINHKSLLEGKLNGKSMIIAFLCIFWLLTQLILFKTFGFKVVNDSPRYIEYAHYVLEHHALTLDHNFWYVGYSLFLAMIFFIGGGIKTTILFQVVLSGIATIAVFKATRNISGNWFAASLSAFFYLFWVKIHQLNFYILTESLFTSMIAICFYLLSKNNPEKKAFPLFLVFFYTFFIRPTGFALCVSLMAFVIHWLLQNKKRYGIILIVFILISIPAAILLLNRMLTTFTLVETFKRGETIYAYGEWLIDSSNVIMPLPETPPLLKLIQFIWLNPVFFLKLSFSKLAFWFLNVKPYFTFLHNLYIVIFLYPIYFFSFKGILLLKADRLKPYRTAALFFILCQALIIMLTVEDWDGRFLLPILPIIMIFAGIGAYNVFSDKVFHYYKTNKYFKAISNIKS